MNNFTASADTEAFLSRLKGAVKAFENKYISTSIGFVDELYEKLCNGFFKDIGFSDYTYFSPHFNSSRKFLSVGDPLDFETELVYLHAIPDKFHQPSHRDYMGALMSMQIDRKLFGDILTTNNCDAYLVLWNKGDVLTHILESFVSCGSARLTLKIVSSETYNSLEMQYEELELVVSSLRADCLVSAIANTSRSRAKALIEAGDFKLFSSPVYNPDHIVMISDVFSVRGFGKFRYNGVLGATRRERTRISLSKFGNYIERNRCQ